LGKEGDEARKPEGGEGMTSREKTQRLKTKGEKKRKVGTVATVAKKNEIVGFRTQTD